MICSPPSAILSLCDSHSSGVCRREGCVCSLSAGKLLETLVNGTDKVAQVAGVDPSHRDAAVLCHADGELLCHPPLAQALVPGNKTCHLVSHGVPSCGRSRPS